MTVTRNGFTAALVVVLVVLAGGAALAAGDASIVRINADLAGGKVSHGSGCFWGSDGRILTAYHVVQGAETIRVYVGGRAYDQVEVVAWAPGHDLVLLQVQNLPAGKAGPGLEPGDDLGPPFDLDLPLEVWGHPVGWRPTYRLKGALGRRDFVSSTSVYAPQGDELFAEDIDLVALDVTVYGGLSGAPVMARDRVVGVLAGSLNEGGSITWAIPVKYVATEMTTVGQPPADLAWPPLSLMTDGTLTRGLNRSQKKPDEQWAVHAGFGVRLEEGFSPDEFGVQVQIVRDNYAHKLSWGMELSSHLYGYERNVPVLEGFEEKTEAVDKVLVFGNGFLVRKHFGTRLRPYYGLSAGLPANLQLRAGFKLFYLFNLELRGMWFRTTEKSIVFNYYGKAVETERDVDVKRLMLGINLELWP